MSKVNSPCVRCCCLDDEDICLGCHRTLSEITEWGSANEIRRQSICDAASDRGKQRRAVRMMREH